MSLYHYTISERILPILSSGEIKLEHDLGLYPSGRLCVWATHRQSWEPTCNKRCIDRSTGIGRRLSFKEMRELGLARLKLSDNHSWITWDEYRQKSNLPSEFISGLEKAAKSWNSNTALYRASFEPVPISKVLDIEFYLPNGERWEWKSVGLPCKNENGINFNPALA